MKRLIANERGQALVMVTLSLVSMFGMMGLAVDVGWSFFVKRSAQAAADAAALGSARAAYAIAGGAGSVTCGGSLACGTLSCPSNPGNGDVAQIACQYAKQNGFVNAGRQTVTITSDVTTPFQTSTGPVKVQYWVTATVTETIPQLFSAVLGNTNATITARATGAVLESVTRGALILLNRQNDGAPIGQANKMAYGMDINVQANDNQGHHALDAASGIIISSTCHGVSTSNTNCYSGNGPIDAGQNIGGGTVYSPTTAMRGAGDVFLQGSSTWTQTPVNGFQGSSFQDPERGKGQPPAPGVLPDVPVLNGLIDGSKTPLLLPGNYYAVGPPQGCKSNCTNVATGAPLTVSGTVRFAACATCNPGEGFGNYVFYGGLTGNTATARFDPGRYVLAGALNGNNLLDTSTNFNMIDATSGYGQNSDAGELFVLTNASYSGLQVPLLVQPIQSQLGYAPTSIVSGNNGTIINLHGLNRQNSLVVGTSLEKFAPSVMWQDQGNSYVHYKADGTIDTSCGSLDSPCTNTLANSNSAALSLQASPDIHLFGAVYQPRGSWLNLLGGGGYAGPLQIVTGAVNVQGNAEINMVQTPQSITTFTAALIE